MAEVIQGAKSREFNKSDIPGIQNTGDTLDYATTLDVPGKRGALDVVIHGSTTVSTGKIIEAGSVRRLIKSTAHGAKKGWIMRPSSGLSIGEEISIVSIVDADFFVISAEFSLAVADTFDICRMITPNYTDTGDLNVVVTASGPVQFLKDTVTTTVEEDTVTPANNEALPTKLFIQKDGVTSPVNKDTGTPGNTVAIPVEIVSASGTTINITAGDINIQTTSEGANFDSMRIGDGTGNYAGITPTNEIKAFDANAVTELGEINTEITALNLKIPSQVGGKVPVDTGLVQGLTDAELRATPISVAGVTSEVVKAGSFDEKLAFSTVQTFTAPAGAVSANIMNIGTENVRYKQGASATGSSGLRLEPGRSEMVMNGSNISIIPETGFVDPCDVAIIWNIYP
jgi:hypothetical protein